MGTTLSTLQPPAGHRKRRKRVGRGFGSGRGKTSTRGSKGQRARRGIRPAFEGGQNPIHRRVPKRGFVNRERVEAHGVNVGWLDVAFDDGAEVDVAALRDKGLVPKRAEVIKLLGDGELKKRLTIKVHRASESARAKVQEAGGTLELLATAVEDSAEGA